MFGIGRRRKEKFLDRESQEFLRNAECCAYMKCVESLIIFLPRRIAAEEQKNMVQEIEEKTGVRCLVISGASSELFVLGLRREKTREADEN